MSKATYMLDTCICSFIMREHPVEVLERLQSLAVRQHRIVISAITYAEMKFGSIGKKASPRHETLAGEFVKRVDAVLPWGREAVDATTEIKKRLADQGAPIGANDAAIAGHAMASDCILVTNNVREFRRVPGLNYEDWV